MPGKRGSSNAVVEQFKKLRDTGKCNMLDRGCILQECILSHGLEELMNYLMDNPTLGIERITKKITED